MSVAAKQCTEDFLSMLRDAVESFLHSREVLETCTQHASEKDLSKLVSFLSTTTWNPLGIERLIPALTRFLDDLLPPVKGTIDAEHRHPPHLTNSNNTLLKYPLKTDESASTVCTSRHDSKVATSLQVRQKQDVGHAKKEGHPSLEPVALAPRSKTQKLMFMSDIVNRRLRRQSFPFTLTEHLSERNLQLETARVYAQRYLETERMHNVRGKSFDEVFGSLPCNEVTARARFELYVFEMYFVEKNTKFSDDTQVKDVLPAHLDTKSDRSLIPSHLVGSLGEKGSYVHDRDTCPACLDPISWGQLRFTCMGLFEATVYIPKPDGGMRPLRLKIQVVPQHQLDIDGLILSAFEIWSNNLLDLVQTGCHAKV